MMLFLNDNEVTIGGLKDALENLDYGPPDGGSFEIIALVDISADGDMYFEVEKHSAF